MLTQNVLIESSTARNNFLSTRTQNQSLECLNKAKAVIMATWQGSGHATTEQVADFYNSPVSTVYEHLQNHKDEFANEVKKVVGDELRELKRNFRFSFLIGSTAHHFTLWTPRGMHRLGFMLRDSEVAKHVRDVTLDIVEAVPNNIVVEIESEFIKGCKDLKQMQDVLGLSSDDPDYRQALKSLMSQRFGIDAITTPLVVVKAKPTVNYSPAPEVVVPVSNPKALCFVVVANTLIKVRKKKQDQDNYMTAGLLTRWSTRLKNVYKKHPTEVAEAMQILCDAGFLKEVAVNCRGAMNYQVVKLPTPNDIKQLTPA